MDINGTIPNTSSIQAPASHEESTTLGYLFGFLLLLCIVVNIYVIWAVMVPLRNICTQRTIKLLIANLAFSCVVTCFAVLFDSGTGASVFRIDACYCHIASYIKHVGACAFASTATAITLERAWAFREHISGHLSAGSCVFILWCLSFTINVPVMYTVRSNVTQVGDEQVEYCQQVLLQNSIVLTEVYEMLIFFLFHFTLLWINIGAILDIRRKLNDLLIISPVPGDTLRRDIRSIQILPYYQVTFVFVWLPLGLIKAYDRIKVRLEISENPTVPSNRTPFFWIITLMATAYFSVTPLICLVFTSKRFARKLRNGVTLVLLSLFGLANTLINRIRSSEASSTESSQHGNEESRDFTRDEQYPMDDLSRVSTLQPSERIRSTEDLIVGYGGARRACRLKRTTSETWV